MKFARTTIITFCLVSFLLGLGFAKTGQLISYELVITSGIFLLVSSFRRNKLTMIFAMLFGFALGWVRGQIFLPNLTQINQLDKKSVTAIVTARSDAFYNERGQMSFYAGKIELLEPYEVMVSGRMTVSGFGVPTVFNGDKLKISGKIYTTRGSRQLGMSFANIELVSMGGSFVDDIRRQFSAGLATAVPEPANSLGIGLLIGQRSTLPDSVESQLSIVGLTHIVAVSGYNLTIIINPLKRLLRKRSKYQIAVSSFFLMAVFLLMTGFQASIVRAAVVSGISLIAWYYGRTIKPLLLIFLAAVLTAGANPFYLWSDIGWYLSFLAFFGVLVIAPNLQSLFYKEKEPKIVGSIFLESFSAIIMTLPLVMFIFGRVSLVALPANLLVVPLVPYAMLLSLIAGIAGAVVPIASGLIAWPATVLMTAMLDVVYIFSKIPNALEQYGVDMIGMITLYASILLVTFILWRKNKHRLKIS